jgi:chromosomal replication initiator protein
MITMMAASELWERALQRIRTNLPAQTYETWFRSLAALENDGGNLILEVPSQFYVDWIDQHYRALIESSVAAAAGQAVGISYHVRTEPEPEDPTDRSPRAT